MRVSNEFRLELVKLSKCKPNYSHPYILSRVMGKGDLIVCLAKNHVVTGTWPSTVCIATHPNMYVTRLFVLWERKGPHAFSRYGSVRIKAPFPMTQLNYSHPYNMYVWSTWHHISLQSALSGVVNQVISRNDPSLISWIYTVIEFWSMSKETFGRFATLGTNVLNFKVVYHR